MNIQWFPGHMAKTRRLLTENIKLIDVIIELLDARIPQSSKNPDMDDLLGTKPRVVVFNKSDLADAAVTTQWIKYYGKKGTFCIPAESRKGEGINLVKSKLREVMKEKIEREKQKGRLIRPIRTMVVGIPNVGKSSFINKIAGKASAVTGDKPGVTRGKQWIRINEEIELLDTPGILWPKFEDENVGLNLAYTGAIKDDVLDLTEVSASLMKKLSGTYENELKSRYKIEDVNNLNGLQLLEAAGRKRGCIISGGEVDYNRISAIVLDEFRGGKIGRISLEKPE
ncbi:MAG: ribosome biogenesis GTPase YlqF [Bacillota bacterium]|nr:ribosome biogenesis GTPase YlqF [Bacillota bacterium]